MRRVKTRLDGDVQILELAWNGEHLDDNKIRYINHRYKTGMNDTGESPVSGTRKAGFVLAQYKGKVQIENFQEGIYVVRNVIQLPINYR